MKAGAVLAKLDARQARSAVEIAEAGRAEAEARVAVLKAKLPAAQDAAKRVGEAASAGAATGQSADESATTLAVLKAEIGAAEPMLNATGVFDALPGTVAYDVQNQYVRAQSFYDFTQTYMVGVWDSLIGDASTIEPSTFSPRVMLWVDPGLDICGTATYCSDFVNLSQMPPAQVATEYQQPLGGPQLEDLGRMAFEIPAIATVVAHVQPRGMVPAPHRVPLDDPAGVDIALVHVAQHCPRVSLGLSLEVDRRPRQGFGGGRCSRIFLTELEARTRPLCRRHVVCIGKRSGRDRRPRRSNRQRAQEHNPHRSAQHHDPVDTSPPAASPRARGIK